MEDESIANVHEMRCTVDPLYRILFAPGSVVIEEETGEEVVFLDHTLSLCIEYVKTKYGSPLMDGRAVARIYNLYNTPVVDATGKTFALLFILRWEPELYKALVSMYVNDSPYTMNGGSRQFDRLMARIEDFINTTLSWHYNKCNITDIVRNFVSSARKEYLMGPLYATTQQ